MFFQFPAILFRIESLPRQQYTNHQSSQKLEKLLSFLHYLWNEVNCCHTIWKHFFDWLCSTDFYTAKTALEKNLRQHCILGITGEVSEIVEDLREIWETFYFHIYWGIFEHTWASSFLSFFLSQRRFYPTCLTSLFDNICTSLMFWFCTRLKPDLFWIRILTFSLLKKITGFLHWFVFHILGMDCVVSNVISRKVKSGSPTLPHLPKFSATKKFFRTKLSIPLLV